MLPRVKVFKFPINDIEEIINKWAEMYQAEIISTSMTYDEKAISVGSVFVIVLYRLVEQR